MTTRPTDLPPADAIDLDGMTVIEPAALAAWRAPFEADRTAGGVVTLTGHGVPCPGCGGTGTRPAHAPLSCGWCAGAGVLPLASVGGLVYLVSDLCEISPPVYRGSWREVLDVATARGERADYDAHYLTRRVGLGSWRVTTGRRGRRSWPRPPSWLWVEHDGHGAKALYPPLAVAPPPLPKVDARTTGERCSHCGGMNWIEIFGVADGYCTRCYARGGAFPALPLAVAWMDGPGWLAAVAIFLALCIFVGPALTGRRP